MFGVPNVPRKPVTRSSSLSYGIQRLLREADILTWIQTISVWTLVLCIQAVRIVDR